MATPTEWLNEFQVNTGSAATGSQSNPKIIGLNNGHFVVAWQENIAGAVGTAAGTDIVAKIFDAEGNVVKNSFQLNVLEIDNESDFDLAATHDGFVMTFYDANDIGNAASEPMIRLERYDFDGIRTSVETMATQVPGEAVDNPQVAANLIASNDDIFTAWEEGTDILGRVVDQTGALGAEFDAAQNSSDPDVLGDVAVLSNGNFVTVYQETDTVTGIEFKIVTPAGVQISNVNVSDAFTGGVAAFDPSVSALEGGGFVITWTEGSDIKARAYSNTGASLFNEITVAGGANIQNESVVVGLPDGDFVVAWDDDTSGNLFARRFNADGTADGATFTVENAGTTSIDIDVTGDGRILFTWVANNGSGEIFASVWDPRPNVIDPDDYDGARAHVLDSDVITTGLGGSTVLAGIGSKTVYGQGGNDIINASTGGGEYFGGGGNDIIFASNNANETLDGGAGVDTLNTTLFNGTYEIDLDSGLTNFAPELFINFENVVTGNGNTTVDGTNGANAITTGNGNDTVNGEGGNDTIVTGAGDDTVDGGSGDDIINTGSGNDTVLSSSGSDTIFLGDGNDTATSSGRDTIFGQGGNDTIFAGIGTPETLDGGTGVDTLDTTSWSFAYEIDLTTGLTNYTGELFINFENVRTGIGNDELLGTNVANSMDGGAGDDRILGFAGNDTLVGGLGNDRLNGGDGSDSISGGDGEDQVYGGTGNDVINGGNDDDLLVGELGNDTINGGAGNDILRGGDGFDLIDGGAGDDTAFGGNDNDTLRGGTGNDTLDGSGGNDFIDGEDGNDTLVGETGADTILGGDGNDIMRGGGGNDFMNGENDNDLMFGSSGEDTMFGGAGDDTMEGNTQSDELYGEAGNDILRGGDGFDFLDGGFGNDILVGGNGNDRLQGGGDADTLRGNAGADIFDFNLTSQSTFAASDLIDGIDGIGVAGGDRIDVSGIDADETIAGNQAFTFLGAVSTAVGIGFGPGSLWVENAGGQTRLYGNTDFDGVIEFAVRIADGGIVAADYTAGDFIL